MKLEIYYNPLIRFCMGVKVKEIIILIILLLHASITFAAKSDCRPELNADNLVVIVDISDPFDEPSSYAFKSLSGRIAKIAPPGGMLFIYDLNKITGNIASAELSICVPSFSNLAGEKLKQRKEKEFLNSVSIVFEKLSKSNNENLSKSPILEGIYKVGLQVFNKDGVSKNGRIILISDLEQNSNLISFYKNGVPDYKDWRATSDSSAWTISMPAVKFTSVLIQRAQKNQKLNMSKVRAFWLDYANNNFNKCGFLGLNQSAVELNNECN